MRLEVRSAIAKINKNGVLLVFPVQNQAEPASLWSEFFPCRKMRWEWNESGDDHVSAMWRLMKRLSENKAVVYSKWYQGRATFFSRDVFAALLNISGQGAEGLSDTARSVLEILEQDSPLSTKELKRAAGLQGRFNEGLYARAMKELFARFLIVGFGEVDDGAFPSLAVGATRLLHEELWEESKALSHEEAERLIEKAMRPVSRLRRFFDRQLNSTFYPQRSWPLDRRSHSEPSE